MKIDRFIILALLLVVGVLAYNKKPKYYHHQTDHVIERIDTLIKDTIIYKTKIRRFKDTIIIFKDSIREAKENNDTVKIIAFQDSLIFKQDYIIKWQDTLIGQLDTIIMYQNRVTDKLKDSVIDLNKDIKKAKRKRIGIFAAIGILTTLNLIK